MFILTGTADLNTTIYAYFFEKVIGSIILTSIALCGQRSIASRTGEVTEYTISSIAVIANWTGRYTCSVELLRIAEVTLTAVCSVYCTFEAANVA